MFNIGHFKGQPTDYIFKYVRGRLAREGRGLAFYYLRHNTQVVVVPTSSTDANFVFNEVTENFQSVTIQGQFTYRIADPKRAAELLNYTYDPARRAYASDDPDRLPQRITNVIQTATRAAIQGRTLEAVLAGSEAIAADARARVQSGGLLAAIGAELLDLSFLNVRPTPEVARALEAEYRESLLRRADEAIAARRGAAVAEERKIKEAELDTEVALEEGRRALIDLQGDNAAREAENAGKALEVKAGYRAKATAMELDVLRTLPPKATLALALRDMGRRADRIGQLTITPEILATILAGRDGPAPE
jgi:hypothetical protein